MCPHCAQHILLTSDTNQSSPRTGNRTRAASLLHTVGCESQLVTPTACMPYTTAHTKRLSIPVVVEGLSTQLKVCLANGSGDGKYVVQLQLLHCRDSWSGLGRAVAITQEDKQLLLPFHDLTWQLAPMQRLKEPETAMFRSINCQAKDSL